MGGKKKRISVQSAKSKGRKLQQWTASMISKITGIPFEKDGDVDNRPMGQAGTDVILRGKAKKLFPWDIECKWQESWSVPSWIKQAKANLKKENNWLLIIKKNRHEEIVILDARIFFKIWEEILKLRKRR